MSTPGAFGFANQLLLVDVTAEHTLHVRKIIQVPTMMTKVEGGETKTVHVGGPHCMRECPVTGDIWAGLKGALKNSPCGKGGAHKSSCCDPEQLEMNMKLLKDLGTGSHDTPPPDDWAVWRLTPSKYDPRAEDGAKGGTLYSCRNSPPMLDFDGHGNCYVPQDASDTMLVINPKSDKPCTQLEVPFPAYKINSECADVTGPAIGKAPDGPMWMSLLGSHNALVRIDPEDNNRRVLYEFQGPNWCKTLRLIHLAFSTPDKFGDDHNRIYALATDLLDDDAVNAVVILRFDPKWTTCLARRIIPLPTQDCACHRVAFIDAIIPGREINSRSIAISELSSSKLLQIKVRNITDMTPLREEILKTRDGYEVRKYTAMADEEGASN